MGAALLATAVGVRLELDPSKLPPFPSGGYSDPLADPRLRATVQSNALELIGDLGAKADLYQFLLPFQLSTLQRWVSSASLTVLYHSSSFPHSVACACRILLPGSSPTISG